MRKIITGTAMIVGAYIVAWFGITRGFETLGKGLEIMVERKEAEK